MGGAVSGQTLGGSLGSLGLGITNEDSESLNLSSSFPASSVVNWSLCLLPGLCEGAKFTPCLAAQILTLMPMMA